jgi:hypothetical protein
MVDVGPVRKLGDVRLLPLLCARGSDTSMHIRSVSDSRVNCVADDGYSPLAMLRSFASHLRSSRIIARSNAHRATDRLTIRYAHSQRLRGKFGAVIHHN